MWYDQIWSYLIVTYPYTTYTDRRRFNHIRSYLIISRSASYRPYVWKIWKLWHIFVYCRSDLIRSDQILIVYGSCMIRIWSVYDPYMIKKKCKIIECPEAFGLGRLDMIVYKDERENKSKNVNNEANIGLSDDVTLLWVVRASPNLTKIERVGLASFLTRNDNCNPKGPFTYYVIHLGGGGFGKDDERWRGRGVFELDDVILKIDILEENWAIFSFWHPVYYITLSIAI